MADFELRTLYNFRQRLSQYNLEHGVNLFASAFADIADQQLTRFAVQTGRQRMDSTQIASNIPHAPPAVAGGGRFTACTIYLRRLTSMHYAELLALYVGETAGHYVYRVKGWSANSEQRSAVAQTLYALLRVWRPPTVRRPAYQVEHTLDDVPGRRTDVQPKAERSQRQCGPRIVG